MSLIVKTKINSIEVLTNPYIDRDECISVNNVLEEYLEKNKYIKEIIKNLTVHQRF